MRILMINVVCGVKSTGRICTELASFLESRGHEVKIAYGRDTVPEQYKKYAVRIGSNIDTSIHGIKARLSDGCGFGSKGATIDFIKWIKAYNPDVIHLHNIHGYYINIDILFNYLRTCRKKIIWTLHDCWAFTGHCSHFSLANCEKWKSGCFQCDHICDYPKSYIDNSRKNWLKKRALFSGIDNLTLVTPSNWLKTIINDSFLKQYNCVSIPNGVNMNVFQHRESDFSEKYSINKKKIIMGCATAWTKSKGLDFFIELARVLSDDYKIVLVGLTKHQLKLLPSNILGITRTNAPEELAEIYSAAYLFVNASNEETMGLTTVEAMACETPVIVTNKTAVPEVVQSDGGCVINDFSPETIALVINGFQRENYKPRLNALNFEINNQYDKYLKLYLS